MRPDGVLLDIHPEPVRPSVELRTAGRVIPVGPAAEWSFIPKIHAIRAARLAVEIEGFFRCEAATVFGFLYHFATVDGFLAYCAEHFSSLAFEDAVIARTRRLMNRNGRDLILRKQISATRLRRATPAAVLWRLPPRSA